MCKKDEIALTTLENNYLIQKSRPLFSLWKSKLTLREFKMLDIFMSKINSRDDSVRTVELTKGELERLYGVVRIKKQELDDCLTHLMQPIHIDDEEEPNGFIKINLFTLAECHKENGVWNVRITCSPEAKKYFFNLENIGYFKYRLKNVRKISGIYTYHLFMYIEMHRPKRNVNITWTVDVDELRKIMHCTDKTYDEFKRFNNLKLTPAANAIKALTDTDFDFKLIKNGKKVTKVEFTFKSNNKNVFDDDETIKAFEIENIEHIENSQSDMSEANNDKLFLCSYETNGEKTYTTMSENFININMNNKTIYKHKEIKRKLNKDDEQRILDSNNELLYRFNSDVNGEFAYNDLIEIERMVKRRNPLFEDDKSIDDFETRNLLRYMEYLENMYAKMNKANIELLEQGKDIQNRTKYFIEMLKNDIIKHES